MTKNWLEMSLMPVGSTLSHKESRVLELMAGYGRNYSVLKKYFKEIEMLDASVEMNKANNHPVKKHKMYIEEFKWP